MPDTDTDYDYYLCKVPTRSKDEFLTVLSHGGGATKVVRHPYWSEMHALKSDLDDVISELDEVRTSLWRFGPINDESYESDRGGDEMEVHHP